MMELHSGYRQATIFDQLWLVLARGLRRPDWLQGRRAWGWTFGILALLFGTIAAAFLLNALHPAGEGGAMASLGSALLSLGVFRHFARLALPLLQVRSGRPVPLRKPAPSPLSTQVPALAPEPARPAPGLSAAERRAYLADLKAAGVNVRIARALVGAGYRSHEAVRRARDAEILAIPGVGPATLRKIRARFVPA